MPASLIYDGCITSLRNLQLHAMETTFLSTTYDFLCLGNIFLLLVLLFLLHYMTVLYEFRGMPPGPRFTCLPVLGNIFSLDLSAKTLPNTFKSLRDSYGGIFSMKLGSFKVVMAAKPEAVKDMLLTKSVDYAGRPQTHAFYTISLGGKDIAFANYGSAWKFYRKLFTTALRQYLSNIPLIEDRVSRQAEKLLQFFEQQDGKLFDPADAFIRAVADVICGITFPHGSDTSNPDLNRLLRLNADTMANSYVVQLVTILDFFPWSRYLPIGLYDRFLQPFFEIHGIIRKLLRERKETFDPTEPVEDFMSALLKTQIDLEAECETDEERAALLSEDRFVITIEDMFLGGFDTASITLRFVVAFLVTYPKFQEDIQRQLDEVVGNRKPSLDDRPNLPLIQATIFEALRVGNTVPLALPHVTLNDTTLCGYRVPKGTFVFANTESVHMDPNCWTDPTAFDPYRHIDKDGKLIASPSNFFPFGAGRRVCAGRALAKVELFLFVSWLLHEFTFVAEDGYQLEKKGAITQFPVRYKIHAIKRK